MENHRELESLLEKYCPRGPRPGFRSQVIALTSACHERTRLRRKSLVCSLAAALLLFAIGLSVTTEAIYRENADILRIGEYEWTKEAEEIAGILGGGGWGRRYLSLQLAAGILVDPSAMDVRRPLK